VRELYETHLSLLAMQLDVCTLHIVVCLITSNLSTKVYWIENHKNQNVFAFLCTIVSPATHAPMHTNIAKNL
jgi:hypothetical protein